MNYRKLDVTDKVAVKEDSNLKIDQGDRFNIFKDKLEQKDPSNKRDNYILPDSELIVLDYVQSDYEDHLQSDNEEID